MTKSSANRQDKYFYLHVDSNRAVVENEKNQVILNSGEKWCIDIKLTKAEFEQLKIQVENAS